MDESRLPPAGPRRIFVVAGEVSGDIQAAHLVRALRAREPALICLGFGGEHMAAAGVHIFEDTSSWGVIGYVDPLLRAPAYLRRLRRVEAAVRAERPDLLLLVDFPAFNLRLAGRLGGVIPTAYYFPPMVSVRRGDRARMVARLGMRLLATLRQEAEAYAAAGADVVFVGHPAVDLVRPRWEAAAARQRFGLSPAARAVGLLPGSRVQEIRAHLPIMLRAAELLAASVPEVRFLLPVPSRELRPLVDGPVAQSRAPVRVVSEIYDAMSVSEVLVAAAGTATLEAAVLGVPMVAVYRLPALSWFIVTRIVSVRHAALPNVLAGREIVPELLQDRMTPQTVAAQVRALLDDRGRAERMREELRAVAAQLGPPGAAGRAADAVLAMLGSPRPLPGSQRRT